MEHEIGKDEPVSLAVVRGVSAIENREPLSLPPLANVLDSDALDTLFEARNDGTPRSGGRLSFVYSNCRVTIDNGEYLTVELLEQLQWEASSRVADDASGRHVDDASSRDAEDGATN